MEEDNSNYSPTVMFCVAKKKMCKLYPSNVCIYKNLQLNEYHYINVIS